ncbi:putative aldehyde reductase [Xylariaceae sp. FL0255]|nr:putative aldehyde reductase [Xylariaceae sp. FL0255]
MYFVNESAARFLCTVDILSMAVSYTELSSRMRWRQGQPTDKRCTKLIFSAGLFTDDNGYNSGKDTRPWLKALQETKDLTSESLDKLHLKQVDISFMHNPDKRIPLVETLSGINSLYDSSALKRFGLSNHTTAEVEEVLKVCTENSHPSCRAVTAPSHDYQKIEDGLLSLLVKHGIAFYAYSPIADGFPAETSEQFRGECLMLKGRWATTSFLGHVEGISVVEMAYRWIVHDSALTGEGDGSVIIGATTIEQWKSALAAIQKEPLGTEMARKIDAL